MAVTDLLGGRLTLMFANLTTVQGHIKAGRVRALAIGTAQRSLVVPDCRPWQRPACPATRPTTGTAWWRRPARRVR